MAANERKVAHAVFEHMDARTDPPLRRLAYRGDTVYVDEAELARGDRFGVFDWREPEPTSVVPLEVMVPAALATGAVTEADVEAAAAATDAAVRAAAARADVVETVVTGPVVPLERPVQSAAKGVWVDYAVSLGMPQAEAEALKKPELIEATKAAPSDGDNAAEAPADAGSEPTGADVSEEELAEILGEPASSVEPLERPARVATHELWVDYAVSRGADREAALAMTREDLITAYPAEDPQEG